MPEPKKEKPLRLWVIYGEEELPLGLAWAKTPGGAMKKFEKATGRTRDGVHISSVDLSKDYVPLVCLT